MNDLDDAIVRVQNKIKRTARQVCVYFIKGKFISTVDFDSKLIDKLVGVYDSRLKSYQDNWLDEDLRWAHAHMKSFREAS